MTYISFKSRHIFKSDTLDKMLLVFCEEISADFDVKCVDDLAKFNRNFEAKSVAFFL